LSGFRRLLRRIQNAIRQQTANAPIPPPTPPPIAAAFELLGFRAEDEAVAGLGTVVVVVMMDDEKETKEEEVVVEEEAVEIEELALSV
jgi:hypothetical protein